jgi:methyl-accepting chemotaxis protein
MINLKDFNLSTIRGRITLLAAGAVVTLAIVGAFGMFQLHTLSREATHSTERDYTTIRLLKSVAEARHYFQSQVQEWKDTLLRGNDPALYQHHFSAFQKDHAAVDNELKETRELVAQSNLPNLANILTVADVDELVKLHDELHDRYMAAIANYNPSHPAAGQEVDRTIRGVDRSFTAKLNKIGDAVSEYGKKEGEASQAHIADTIGTTYWLTVIALVLSIPLLAVLGFFIARGILGNLASFQGTIDQIQGGDYSARANIKTRDELGQLASAFNALLDGRVETLANIQRENEKLNESVLDLLRAVAQLSRKDLTVRIPVSEDVTGAVSDALNLLAGETAKVLQDVSNISAEVTAASLEVQKQSDTMLLNASREREEVDSTAQSLSHAAEAMRQIADLALRTNEAADHAIRSTQTALASVTNTVSGINSTRDVIRETEKRIKRLGERSQEISGVVNLINTIAERTHILALNASMHAASAGEAGRGFAVVADEVQRLAENARQATQQIAALVNNIQVETSDTVNTMNSVITQIVEGSRLAEQAGEQMQVTQKTTSDLVSSVRQIAATSSEQIQVSQELVQLASMIRDNSQKTSEQLMAQSSNTNSLVEYAKQLLASVRVFKLPA